MRPKSAKPGVKRVELDESMQEYEVIREKTEGNKHKQQRMLSATHQNNTRKIRPVELTTSEFARIMPKHIYQDKQRLYGQALQLKQNMHGVLDQNTKLKTKIAILEKENQKLLLRKDGPSGPGYDSKARMYSTNGGTATDVTKKPFSLHILFTFLQNTMIASLKKMLREAREQVAYLKQEGQKLKKAVKYTKVSELEAENNNLMAELSRLQKMIEQLIMLRDEQTDYQSQIEELESFLKAKIQENEHLINTNRRISDQIDSLEETLKATQAKTAEREKKLLKDLDLAKRRLVDSQRELDFVKGELIKQKEIKQQQSTSKNIVNNRPTSSVVGIKAKNGTNAAAPPPADNQEATKLMKEIEQLKKQNQDLATKIKHNTTAAQQSKVSAAAAAPAAPPEPESAVKQSPTIQNKSIKPKPAEEQELAQKPATPTKSNNPSAPRQHTNKSDQYGQDFENEAAVAHKTEETEAKPKVEETSYKQDFGDQEEQEILFKKQQPTSQEAQSSKKKKKKVTSAKKQKPGKSAMAQISQLLTYRMRGQRYPFDQLKQDILDAGEQSFRVSELMSMFENSPFFLNQQQIMTILKYFMDAKNKPLDPKATLDVQTLIQKLRKVLKDFTMLEEDEQEEMYMRIAQMVTTYASELETAFEQEKNGEGTITKDNLENLFRRLELDQSYIQLILSELSLASQDMQHLSYYEFFKKFYVDDNMEVREVDEEYEENQSNPRTLNRHMIQQQQIEESEEGSRRSKNNLRHSQRHKIREDSQEI